MLKCLLCVFQLAYKPCGYNEWQNCWWGKDCSLFLNVVVVYAYMYSFMVSICYYIVSVCLKLPCTLALWYFLFVKLSLLRKIEVAITIILTIWLATSDSPEVMLSKQWVDIMYPVCTKYFCEATDKVWWSGLIAEGRNNQIVSWFILQPNTANYARVPVWCCCWLQIPICTACVCVSYFQCIWVVFPSRWPCCNLSLKNWS